MTVGPMEKTLAVAYFLPVMVIGISGNSWVIVSLIRILYKTWSPMNSVFKHMSLYILSLSIADMCVLCMTPSVTSYFILGSWELGYVGCKIFFAVENINKLLSVAILAVMSFERFLVVCRPFQWFCCRRKRVSNVFTVVIILLAAIGALCSPIIYYAETTVVPDYYNQGENITTCSSNLPDDVMSVFITYMFILGFVLPVLFISACYFFLIRHLRNKDGKSMFVTSYTTRVVRSILTVVLFHFACWTPFWVFVVVPMLSYFGIVEFTFLESDYSQKIRMFSSFLPYLNSAGNWIFYSRAITHASSALVKPHRRVAKPAPERRGFLLKTFGDTFTNNTKV
ncbi:unnamed protein product [Bursaphelenchus okinawaensis]|uniref:G-protein coupled receptors family 1 profile domain-containing protein n=1 Tax=Bursaphelenchus okinawaensis TaxID=465554 RepID=A0A811LK43_9BILA|nr:unnamed protein product [Bursaphelenchus okinawaensis]CAG9125178.1 unnamed protein product [Bursaphelenchus okinawaensis]